MLKSVCSTFLALGLVVGGATLARADLCLNVGGPIYVGKGAKIPPKGKCKPFVGFANLCISVDDVVTGTICTASDDTHVDIGLTTICANTNFVAHDYVVLLKPSLTGADYFNVPDIGSGGFAGAYGASVVPCSPSSPPVPIKVWPYK